MYAVRKVYTKQWDHQKPEERYTVQIARGGKPVPGIEPDRISAVEEEVMYWRKANHIHAWFVKNVQDGEDDCGRYLVGGDEIRELHDVCEEVIRASKLVDGMVFAGRSYVDETPVEHREPGKVIEDTSVAEELLPRQAGFFFGNVEYDEDYLTDVIATHNWAARMLADSKAGVPGDIYYSSSW